MSFLGRKNTEPLIPTAANDSGLLEPADASIEAQHGGIDDESRRSADHEGSESSGSFTLGTGAEEDEEQRAIGFDPSAHGMSLEREQEIIQVVGERPEPLPLLGRLRLKSQYSATVGAMAVSFAAAIGLAAYGFIGIADNTSRVDSGNRLEVLTQRILASAQYAVKGEKTGLDRLSDARQQAAQTLRNLDDGRAGVSRIGLADNENLRLANVAFRSKLLPVADQILAMAPSLTSLQRNTEDLEQTTTALFSGSEQLVTLFQSSGASPIYVTAANHIRMLSERARRNGSSLLSSSDVRGEPLAEYSTDVESIRRTIDSLVKGNSAIGMTAVVDPHAISILKALNESSVGLFRIARFVDENAAALLTARKSLSALSISSEEALTSVSAFRHDMQAGVESSFSMVYAAALAAALGLLSLFLVGLVHSRATRVQAWIADFTNVGLERSLVDLMYEMQGLEAGDLTTRFTSMEAYEGPTGGIRSSVNEATIALHDAVSTVKRTAGAVSTVVTESVRGSFLMQDSNERQSEEIVAIVERVTGFTAGIETVSAKTATASTLTEDARVASEEGADVVTQTNVKMAEIRSNMQSVLKSVKQLADSAHDVGEIVTVIDKITDRTQVLAVNASLEAAKAGSAGQGFQVIAHEVSRLAEQANDALRTITALVQRIRTETSMTISAVEESTKNVVEGAKLSDVATEKLSEIQRVSVKLAALMREIGEQSATQGSSATDVAEAMRRLDTLSREFQVNVANMVAGVQEIDASMSVLKDTVSVFTTEDDKTAALHAA